MLTANFVNSEKSSSRQLQASTRVQPMTKPEDVPLFADGFGYLLTNEASIDTLNEKLANKKTDVRVEHRRFRPNIVVSGKIARILKK